ncbi:hypothetical protein TNCV_1085811 [Trichonephila clavipes]|nr:hypothetical protein TNCV_1085811 [Trichonephila clavipes]
MNAGIWSTLVELKKLALMQIFHFFHSCCKEYRPPRSLNLNLLHFLFLFWGHLKSLMFETLGVTMEDLMARIVVALSEIASTPNLFERFGVNCAMTYVASTSSNCSGALFVL